MSGVSRGTATGRVGRWWQNWRFHLNALAILVPIVALPSFYQAQRVFSGDAGLGAREAGIVQVGPFDLRLAEFLIAAPHDSGVAGARKEFTLALCEGCDDRIRAVYIRIGKPRSLRAAGTLFSGPPARLFADIPVPESVGADDGLWLTVEQWDGTIHKGEIAIELASPATADWLRGREEAR